MARLGPRVSAAHRVARLVGCACELSGSGRANESRGRHRCSRLFRGCRRHVGFLELHRAFLATYFDGPAAKLDLDDVIVEGGVACCTSFLRHFVLSVWRVDVAKTLTDAEGSHDGTLRAVRIFSDLRDG